ncbi:hypothetical protein BC939DRAFT_449500 [Gamsiella multidivaricata]|uniref:uncharacterized protein n=1 Tax=Gamsiella multidivaricata TaxID=101098 RepID=UPI00222097C6|nr:uncharacterized protein BC939DRAFT_449500 [Gamsiella multidivaricata]KAI7824879.1 hypothetical protein BC939DRAFT_449500 [Gamsiella multidivaricata]
MLNQPAEAMEKRSPPPAGQADQTGQVGQAQPSACPPIPLGTAGAQNTSSFSSFQLPSNNLNNAWLSAHPTPSNNDTQLLPVNPTPHENGITSLWTEGNEKASWTQGSSAESEALTSIDECFPALWQPQETAIGQGRDPDRNQPKPLRTILPSSVQQGAAKATLRNNRYPPHEGESYLVDPIPNPSTVKKPKKPRVSIRANLLVPTTAPVAVTTALMPSDTAPVPVATIPAPAKTTLTNMSNNAQDRMAQEDNSSVRVTSVRIGAASASADITSTAPSNNIEVRQVEDANSSNKRRPRERSTRLGLKRRGKYRPRKPKAWLRLFMDPNSLSPVGDDNADKSGDDDDDDDERPAKRSKSINKQYGPRLLDKDGNPWLLDPPVMEYPYLQEAFPYEEYKTPENRVETTTYGTMPNPLPDAWYAPQSPFITRDFFSIKKFEYAKKLFKAIEVNTADLRMDIYYQRGFELASKRMLDRVRAEKWKALETRNGKQSDRDTTELHSDKGGSGLIMRPQDPDRVYQPLNASVEAQSPRDQTQDVRFQSTNGDSGPSSTASSPAAQLMDPNTSRGEQTHLSSALSSTQPVAASAPGAQSLTASSSTAALFSSSLSSSSAPVAAVGLSSPTASSSAPSTAVATGAPSSSSSSSSSALSTASASASATAPETGPSPDSSSSKLDEPTLTDYYQVNTYLAQLFVPMVKNDPIPLSPAAYRILQTMMMGMENKIIAMGCQRQRAELTARLSKVDAKSRRKDLRQYRRPKIVDVDEWIFGYPFNRREDEEEYLRDRKKQEEAMALRPGQRPAFVSNPLEIPLEMEPFHQARERMQKWKK